MKLKYVGDRLSTGEPAASLVLEGIPAGDLDDRDLTPEQVKRALGSGLYAWATPPKERAAAKRTAAKRADAPEPPAVVDASSDAPDAGASPEAAAGTEG